MDNLNEDRHMMLEAQEATPSVYRRATHRPCSKEGGSEGHIFLDLSAKCLVRQSPTSVHNQRPVLTWLVVQIHAAVV